MCFVGLTFPNPSLVSRPKKITWNATQILSVLHTASSYAIQISFGSPQVDWAGLKKKRDEYIAGLRDRYEDNAYQDGIHVVKGKAEFLNANQVQVIDKDGKKTVLNAEHVSVTITHYDITVLPPLKAHHAACASVRS